MGGTTVPTEYIAYPDGYVRPSEYIAMPTIYTPGVMAVIEPNLPAVVEPNMPSVMAPTLPAAAPTLPEVVEPAPIAATPPVAKTPGNGLIQIETDPVKLNTVAQFTATAERHSPRRRRERQREVYVENEPLVQIETQHTPQG